MHLIACYKAVLPKRKERPRSAVSSRGRFFLLLCLGLFLTIQASAQNVTLNERRASLQQVLQKIKDQTGYTAVFQDQLMQKSRPVDITVQNEPLETVLRQLFKDQPLSYDIVDNKVISIKEKVAAPSTGAVQSSQNLQISGVMKDEKGVPLIGATVAEKGTTNGTSTDENGMFRLKVGSESAVLIFNYTGLKKQEESVGSRRTFDVVLMPDMNTLEGVVVVGYGTQRQKDVTGAVSSISSEDFNQGPVLSAQQSIQGKLAGVNIAQNSGKPGGSNTVRVRGGTSLTGSNDPLYVIDGVPLSTTAGVAQANIRGAGTDVFDAEPTNPLLTINPDDIESVTVLKDASASAIYGSRAANGVIVITTKKGSAGAMKVSLGATGGLSRVAKKLDVLTAGEYRAAVQRIGVAIDDKGANTDWQDEIYRTAYLQDYFLSLSGGANKTTYRASLGYGDQEGIMLGSSLNRANARINLNHSALDDRLTFDLRTNYGQTVSNSAPVSNTVGSEAGTSMNYEAYVFNPTYPVYDPNGNFYHVRPYRVNPVSYSKEILDQLTNSRFLGNLSTTYKIIKSLSINVNLGYTNQRIDRNSYIYRSNLLGEGLGGYASTQKLTDYSKLLESILRYNEKFGKHSIDALVGYSYQYFQNQGNRVTANGFLSDEFKWYSMQAARTISSVPSFQSSNTLISMYGRLNYNFDDRFLVTATLRRDGSSRFGPENQWGYFPSGSLAWRLSQEKFFNVKPISDLKIRASYGVTGNQEIGNLNSVTTLGATTTGYIIGSDRVTVVLPQQYENPNIKWEQTAQFDAGVDFGLLDNRVRGSMDFYNKKTSDLLLTVLVPQPTAINSQVVNVGSVQNRGIELQLNADIIRGNNFNWESGFNLSRNRNKVLSLSNDLYKGDNIRTAPIQGTVSGGFAQLIMPGQPLGTFYGRRFAGIKDSTEQYVAGADTILGSAQPKFTFGFNNTVSYKRFSLSFLLRGTVGNKIYNLTGNNLGYLNNLPGKNVLETAVTSGLKRDQPKVYSTRWIEDGSFLRLDNITLSYTINTKYKFLSNARVFLTGQNLFVITGYSGLDPEVNSEISATGVAPLGIDYLSYPKARSLSFGFNTTF